MYIFDKHIFKNKKKRNLTWFFKWINNNFEIKSVSHFSTNVNFECAFFKATTRIFAAAMSHARYPLCCIFLACASDRL